MHRKKQEIPNVSEAKDLVGHLKIARHAADQVEAGFYDIKDVEEEDLGDGEVRISFTRFETNPEEDAAPFEG